MAIVVTDCRHRQPISSQQRFITMLSDGLAVIFCKCHIVQVSQKKGMLLLNGCSNVKLHFTGPCPGLNELV